MGEMMASLSEASIMVICLDEFQEYDWNGRLFVRTREDACLFRSTLELLELMEENYDELDYPQMSMNNRRFSSSVGTEYETDHTKQREDFRPAERGKRAVVLSKEDLEQKRGGTATILVRVQYRQRATWQGQVTWLEKNRTVSFRSALELLKLIDSVENGKESWWI